MTTRKNGATEPQFKGFIRPAQNWFRLPNNWTDLTASMQSWSEQKVVEYVLRHTWGYHEYGLLKEISLDEFANGRKRHDGTRMDVGIGMNKQAIISGIRQAIEDGFLVEQVDDSDRGRIKKYYGLRMSDEETPLYEDHTPEVRRSSPPRVNGTHRTTERHLEKETSSKTPEETTTGTGVVVDLISFKVARDRAEELARTYDEEHIYTKIEFLEWKMSREGRGKIKDPAAWLVTAIERDYQPPDSFKTSWELEAEETDRRAWAKELMDRSLARFAELYPDPPQ
jgi:hypothetical protein